jgi:hypothetical protein
VKIDREKFLSYLGAKLDDIDKRELNKNRIVTVEKVLLYVLDSVHKGNFRGIISIKIDDGKVYSPRVDQMETIVENEYKWLDI